MPDPASAYAARLAAWRSELARHDRRVRLAGWARGAAALGAVAAIALAAERGGDPRWLFVPLAAFAVSGVALVAADRRRARAHRMCAWYEAGLERVRGAWWSGSGGVGHAPADHPYALDLDVVGDRSLFARLDTTCTHPGSARLAAWLLTPAAPAEIRRRQAAVRELTGDLALREALVAAAGARGLAVEGVDLTSWAEGASFLPQRWLRPLLVGLAAVAVGTTVGWIAGAWTAAPAVAAAVSAFAIGAALHRRVSAAVAGAAFAAGPLAAVAAASERIEARCFSSPFLAEARSVLSAHGSAAAELRSVARAFTRIGLARNELVAPFAYALGWPALEALAIERWRVRNGARVRGWIAAVADVDAALALATYAFENPSDPFPELTSGPAPAFDADGLGHPLLPPGACVRNDVRLGAGHSALLVVSGSNMSGKSTLLRAVGLNAVLALAGAPVRATRLRLSPLAVHASIRSRDSVLDGVSRFQAEAVRLGSMLSLARSGAAVLFLVDELLHGTNSADRAEGGAAFLRELVSSGAVGLCTTHDLVLAQAADALGSRAANLHFADALRDGRLVFDYRLRSGPATRSNALALLRAAGVPV